MSAVEILREARALIADKSRWTQKAFARDNAGRYTDENSNEAICFCAAGAVLRAASRGPSSYENDAFEVLSAASYDLFREDSVLVVNDGLPDRDASEAHDDVLKVFDLAIRKAEAANA
ncbi:DUF6197 family protein [Methylobacterium sp. Gmos1]